MPDAGFFEQRRNSPTGFVLVVAMHAAAFTALALAKTPQFLGPNREPINIFDIPITPDPPPVPPVEPPRPSDTTITRSDTQTVLRDRTETATDPTPNPPPPPTNGAGRIEFAGNDLPVLPIRREAELIPGDLQPPYPVAEERAQRGGRVQVRVTIGPNGRVTGVERLFATSDAFWRVTERQALSRWRFRPATLDGRPVAASKVMTVTFRIDDL